MTTLPGLTVRELGAADLDAYKALRDHALAHHEEAFTSDAATEARRSAASYAARLGSGADAGFTLGAWRGDRLVGAISCERDARNKVRHIGHIVGTMVHGDEQGRGVGRALLDALIERAAADNELHQLTLSVTAGNDRAERLYARAGFVRYGTLPRAIRVGGRFLDKHHLMLNLRQVAQASDRPSMSRKLSTVSVRQAVDGDLDALAALFDSYRQFQGKAGDLGAAAAFLRERFNHGQSVVFIALEGAMPVGFAQLYPSFSSVSLSRVFILNDLFVEPTARNKGAGSVLLAALESYAWAMGASRISLNVARKNEPAQVVYESGGWVKDAEFFMYHRFPPGQCEG